MDPLAHSLVGAALARTSLGRGRRLALPTLVLAANVPDVDVVSYAWGSDAALAFRRGLTHGPLGLALLPALVAVVVWLVGRRRPGPDPAAPAEDGPDPGDWAHRPPRHPGPSHRAATHREPRQAHPPPGARRRRAAASSVTEAAGAAAAQPSLRALLALSYLAALTHPALDWLNTYGVRLLHPFDRRWFYGDTLFIVDPWMWLLLAAATVLGRAATAPPDAGGAGAGRRGPGTGRSLLAAAAWIALALATTSLLLAVVGSAAGRALWLGGIAAIAAAALAGRPGGDDDRRRLATALVLVFAVYLGLSLVAATAARQWVRRAVAEPVEALMVGPLPVTPLRREVVAATPGEVRRGEFRWLPSPHLEWSGWARPRPGDSQVVAAALADPSVRGFRAWARFLVAEIDEHPDRWEVHLLDPRYTTERDARIGSAVVRVPRPPRAPGG